MHWLIWHMINLRILNDPNEMTTVDYINEFERLNNKIHQPDMVLPTDVLAYKVLNNANISSEKKQLIRASGHYAVPISKTSQLVEEFDKRNKVIDICLSINELKKSHIMKKLL